LNAALVADWNDVSASSAFRPGQAVTLFLPVRANAPRARAGTRAARATAPRASSRSTAKAAVRASASSSKRPVRTRR
jgi:membrane-bound lytic murein transglycosylase D